MRDKGKWQESSESKLTHVDGCQFGQTVVRCGPPTLQEYYAHLSQSTHRATCTPMHFFPEPSYLQSESNVPTIKLKMKKKKAKMCWFEEVIDITVTLNAPQTSLRYWLSSGKNRGRVWGWEFKEFFCVLTSKNQAHCRVMKVWLSEVLFIFSPKLSVQSRFLQRGFTA